MAIGFEFLRDSLPDRRRQRFGDVEYDWEYRVDTTSANVTWRSRLIGLLNSPYQPVEADLFREMMAKAEIDYTQFTFIDIGSGKGRALLLASEYPFQRVIGIEFLPELNAIAEQNIRKFSQRNPGCGVIELICCDATEYKWPKAPLLVFLNNPLPEEGLRKLILELEYSVRDAPRPVFVLYANPVLERIVSGNQVFEKLTGTQQYAIFRNDWPG